VADSSGHFVERADYSAFGGMRASIGAVPVGLTALATTTRGFTGHEQLGSIDTIHMNGRIYDPKLGRFLQADPMVAEPDNPQNWNPYSYVFNNPLANTDPTGMFSLRQALGTLFAIVATVFAPEGAGFWYSVLVGATAGIISTGTLKGGLIGAFSAGLFYGIGQEFQAFADENSAINYQASLDGDGGVDTVPGTGLSPGEFGAKVLEHGVAGGVMSSLSGGRFGYGFASAGFSEAAAPAIGTINSKVEQGVLASIVGGTASALSGGKFADGAETAAFSYAFNNLAHDLHSSYSSDRSWYHHYLSDWAICNASQAWCTQQLGFATLVAGYSYPGQDEPVTNGERSAVSFMGFSPGHIFTYLDPGSYSIFNVTDTDHFLYNGYVERSLIWKGDTLYLQTYGEGNNQGPISWFVNVTTWAPAFNQTNYQFQQSMIQTWLKGQH
jgi:RHS repeat-associated protein